MLQLSSISKAYAGRVLFDNVSFQINRGDRCGLVGPNGAGKTTLFSIIMGDELPDEGKIHSERGMSIGYLPQESAPVGDETVMELATSHVPDHSAWEAEPRAERILRGLAFRESDFQRPARTLSGGWIMRAHLARLLVQEPDVLLLDEPTNHLDLESLLWFQEYLKGYPGAILMISHDREFLNSLLKRIIELAYQKANFYNGNYDSYLREKEARAAQHLAAYENQQREIGRLQDFADRFRAKASKAAQAQSKLKQIDRMEKIEAPLEAAKTVKFRFPQPVRSGQRVLHAKDVSFGYDATSPIYNSIDYEIERGARTVLVGPNGAGKSTLLKLLAGGLQPTGGSVIVGHNVKTGYFSQNRVEMLKMGRTVLQEAMELENRQPEQFVRTLLGSFLFSGEAVDKPVSVLSGGEKSRLALCKLLLDPPNCLLLDEPTTHLDMASIDALIGALQSFDGTIVFISHDVHFIRKVGQAVLHISAGQLTPYAGDYQYYLDRTKATNERSALVAGEKLTNARPDTIESAPATKEKIFLTKEERRAASKEREAKQTAKRDQLKRIGELEKEIARIEARQNELTVELENPTTYDNANVAMKLNRELMSLTEALAQVTKEWETLLAATAE